MDNGFAILGEQARLLCAMRVDGESIQYEVCADFVVERDGQSGVVEVKTGAVANAAFPATRRQMFEYATLYGVDRMYMFDGDRGQLQEIAFQTAPSVVPRPRYVGWPIGFACGVICTPIVIWLLMLR